MGNVVAPPVLGAVNEEQKQAVDTTITQKGPITKQNKERSKKNRNRKSKNKGHKVNLLEETAEVLMLQTKVITQEIVTIEVTETLENDNNTIIEKEDKTPEQEPEMAPKESEEVQKVLTEVQKEGCKSETIGKNIEKVVERGNTTENHEKDSDRNIISSDVKDKFKKAITLELTAELREENLKTTPEEGVEEVINKNLDTEPSNKVPILVELTTWVRNLVKQQRLPVIEVELLCNNKSCEKCINRSSEEAKGLAGCCRDTDLIVVASKDCQVREQELAEEQVVLRGMEVVQLLLGVQIPIEEHTEYMRNCVLCVPKRHIKIPQKKQKYVNCTTETAINQCAGLIVPNPETRRIKQLMNRIKSTGEEGESQESMKPDTTLESILCPLMAYIRPPCTHDNCTIQSVVATRRRGETKVTSWACCDVKKANKELIKVISWNAQGLYRRIGSHIKPPKNRRGKKPKQRSSMKEQIKELVEKELPIGICYQETMLACGDKTGRKGSETQIEEMQEYHHNLGPGYALYLAFSTDGCARYGTGIAIRSDVKVIQFMDRLTNRAEACGRFAAAELQHYIIATVYTQNKDEGREEFFEQLTAWGKQQQKPVLWYMDSNQIGKMDSKHIELFFPEARTGPRPQITEFLDAMGKPKFNSDGTTYGVGSGPIFAASRAKLFKEWCSRNGVVDVAYEWMDRTGEMEHTSHWQFLAWHKYARGHRQRYVAPWTNPFGPMWGSRIDVCAIDPKHFELHSLRVVKNPEAQAHYKTEKEQLTASYCSDHYPLLVELHAPIQDSGEISIAELQDLCGNIRRARILNVEFAVDKLGQETIPVEEERETLWCDAEYQTEEQECEIMSTTIGESILEEGAVQQKMATKWCGLKKRWQQRNRQDITNAKLMLYHEQHNKLGNAVVKSIKALMIKPIQEITEQRMVQVSKDSAKLAQEAWGLSINWKYIIKNHGRPTPLAKVEREPIAKNVLKMVKAFNRESIEETVPKWGQIGVSTVLAAAMLSHTQLRRIEETTTREVKISREATAMESAAVQLYYVTGDAEVLKNTRFKDIPAKALEGPLSSTKQNTVETLESEKVSQHMTDVENRHYQQLQVRILRKKRNKGTETIKSKEETITEALECSSRSESLEEGFGVAVIREECMMFSSKKLRNKDIRERNGKSKAEQKALREGTNEIFLSQMVDAAIESAATCSTAKINCLLGMGTHGSTVATELVAALYDTGCSFVMVSEAAARAECRKQGQHWGKFVLPYPVGMEPPEAQTAKAGQRVVGMGLIPITLSLAVFPDQNSKGDNFKLQYGTETRSGLQQEGCDSETMTIELYAHVFSGVATTLLLGTPFKRRYVKSDDSGPTGRMVLREKPLKLDRIGTEIEEEDKDKCMYYQQSSEVPLAPVIAYAQHEVIIEPGETSRIPIYYQNQSTFKEHAYFGKENGRGVWFTLDGEGRHRHKINYQIHPATEYRALQEQAGQCAIVGSHNMEGRRLHIGAEPTVTIHNKQQRITVARGTPLGVIQATCRGEPLEASRNRGYRDPREVPLGKAVRVRMLASDVEGETALIRRSRDNSHAKIVDSASQIMSVLCKEARQHELSKWTDDQLRDKGMRHRHSYEDGRAMLWNTVPPDIAAAVRCYEKPLGGLLEQLDGKRHKEQEGAAAMLSYLLASLRDNVGGWSKLDTGFVQSARKTMLDELRRDKNWRKWFKEHARLPEVIELGRDIGLKLEEEVEAEGYEVDKALLIDYNSDYEEDEEEEGMYIVSTEVQEAFERHDKDTEEIVGAMNESEAPPLEINEIEIKARDVDKIGELLTGNREDDPDAVLEDPVSIPTYLQRSAEDIAALYPLLKRVDYYNGVVSQQMHERFDPRWYEELKIAGRKSEPEWGKQQIDERAARGASYLCQVRLEHVEISMREAVYKLLMKHESLWNIDGHKPPLFKGPDFDYIRLKPNVKPIQHTPRRLPPAALPAIYKQVKQWLEQGVIVPSSSPHDNPIVVVPKKALKGPTDEHGVPLPGYVAEKRWRLCLDFTLCNSSTEPCNTGGVPRVDEIIEQVCNADRHLQNNPAYKYKVSAIDLFQGFAQWRLSDAVRPLTAFSIPGMAHTAAHVEFSRLPFGLAPSPGRFSDIVGDALGGTRFGNPSEGVLDRLSSLSQVEGCIPEIKPGAVGADGDGIRQCCTHFIDDVAICGMYESQEKELQDLDVVFDRLRKGGFGMRLDKAELLQDSLVMLGWEVSKGQRRADRAKVEGIVNMADTFEDRSKLQSFLGMVGYYRDTIPVAADCEKPLFDLCKKGAFKSKEDWTPIHTACVQTIKKQLDNMIMLAVPRIGREKDGKLPPPLCISVDASEYAIGVTMSQIQENGIEQPIIMAHKTLSGEQRGWSTSERECYGLLWALHHKLRPYVFGHDNVVVYTDHKPLLGIFKKASSNAKLRRWANILSMYNFKLEHRCGVDMGPSDTLSRCAKDSPSITQLRIETPENRKPVDVHHGVLDPVENKGPGSGEEGGKYKVPQQRLAHLKGHASGVSGLCPTVGAAGNEVLYIGNIAEHHQQKPEAVEESKVGEVAQDGKTSETGNKTRAGKKAGYVELSKNLLGLDTLETAQWCQNWGIDKERQEMLHILQRVSKAEGLDGRAHITTALNPKVPKIPNSRKEQEEIAERILKEHVVVWVAVHQTTCAELIKESGFTGGDPSESEYILQFSNSDLSMNNEVFQFENRLQAEKSVQERGSNYTKGRRKGLRARLASVPPHYSELTTPSGTKEMGRPVAEYDTDYQSEEEVVYSAEEWHDIVQQEVQQLKEQEPYYQCLADTEQGVTEVDLHEPTPVVLGSGLELIKAHLEYGVRKCRYQRGLDPEPTTNMQSYINALCDPEVIRIIVNGTAGTGKTFTAMAYAAMAIKAGIVTRVRCTRPTVSCGSSSGYLPGTSAQKQAPWSAPCTEAAERIGLELDDEEKSRIGTWPADKIKGLSLGPGEMFVFDEGQNAEGDSFYCTLSRGEQGSKVVIAGDRYQCDLPGKLSNNNSMARFVDNWKELSQEATINMDRITEAEQQTYKEARESCANLKNEIVQIELEPTAAMRSKKAKDLNNLWHLDKSGLLNKKGVKKQSDNMIAAMEYQTPETRSKESKAPIFAAFAGADNLTIGAKHTFQALQCIGASEHNGHARKVFNRRHGFMPFKSHERVPDEIYKKIWAVFSGAPCVAYSLMGAQKGLSDPRGVYYVEQVDQYIETGVPVIVLEQVKGVRDVSNSDKVSQQNKISPQSKLCEKLRRAGYHIISRGEEKEGFILNSADYGSVIDRDRLITIAVTEELWQLRGDKVIFPQERPIASRNAASVFRELQEEYVAQDYHKEGFNRSENMSRKGARRLWSHMGKGEPYAPSACYDANNKAPSPTARGNSRWFEWEDKDGNRLWRRWSPWEMCNAQGIELDVVQGMSREEIYNVAGNAVPLEMAQAIGEIVKELWDPGWFTNNKRQRNNIQVSEVKPMHTGTARRKEWRRKMEYQEQNTDSRRRYVRNKGNKEEDSIATSDFVREDGVHTNTLRSDSAIDLHSKEASIVTSDFVREDGVHTSTLRLNSAKDLRNKIKEPLVTRSHNTESCVETDFVREDGACTIKSVSSPIERSAIYGGVTEEDLIEVCEEDADDSVFSEQEAEAYEECILRAEQSHREAEVELYLVTRATSENPAEIMETEAVLTPVKVREPFSKMAQAPVIRRCRIPELIAAQKNDVKLRCQIAIQRGEDREHYGQNELEREKNLAKSVAFRLGFKNTKTAEVLHHIETTESGELRTLCIPASMQDELLTMQHGGLGQTMVHIPPEGMYKQMKTKYYWEGMKESCNRHHKHCNTCQRTAPIPMKCKGEQTIIPVTAPMATVAFDIVGPIGAKATTNGNRFIISAIDYFTRWMEAIPIAEPTSEAVAEAMLKFVSRHGCPSRIVTDEGSCFTSKVMQTFEQGLGLKHHMVSCYRPQGNSRLERVHKTLGRKLRTQLIQTQSYEWDRVSMDLAVFSYNATPHSATSFSPFHLLYGREPYFPFDVTMEPDVDTERVSHEEHWHKIREELQKAQTIAYERMTAHQRESVARTAQHNTALSLHKQGEQVLLYVPTVPKGISKKLCIRWHGPYQIAAPRSGHRYLLQVPGKELGSHEHKWVHETRVKSYYAATEKINTAEDSQEVLEKVGEHLTQPAGSEHVGIDRNEEQWPYVWHRDDLKPGTYPKTDNGLVIRQPRLDITEPIMETDTLPPVVEYYIDTCKQCGFRPYKPSLCKNCIQEAATEKKEEQFPCYQLKKASKDSVVEECANPECVNQGVVEKYCKCEGATTLQQSSRVAEHENPVLITKGDILPVSARRETEHYKPRTGLEEERLEPIKRPEKKEGEVEYSIKQITSFYHGHDDRRFLYTVLWDGPEKEKTATCIGDLLSALSRVEQFWNSEEGARVWHKIMPKAKPQATWCLSLHQEGYLEATQTKVAAIILHTLQGFDIKTAKQRVIEQGFRDMDQMDVILAVHAKQKPPQKYASNIQEIPYLYRRVTWDKVKIMLGEQTEDITLKLQKHLQQNITFIWLEEYKENQVFGNARTEEWVGDLKLRVSEDNKHEEVMNTEEVVYARRPTIRTIVSRHVKQETSRQTETVSRRPCTTCRVSIVAQTQKTKRDQNHQLKIQSFREGVLSGALKSKEARDYTRVMKRVLRTWQCRKDKKEGVEISNKKIWSEEFPVYGRLAYHAQSIEMEIAGKAYESNMQCATLMNESYMQYTKMMSESYAQHAKLTSENHRNTVRVLNSTHVTIARQYQEGETTHDVVHFPE